MLFVGMSTSKEPGAVKILICPEGKERVKKDSINQSALLVSNIATSTRNWGWQLGLISFVAISVAITSSKDCALAQMTPDDTLPNNSRVTTQGDTRVIQGGTQAGSNLFHSFEQFSLPNGSTAYFNNALNIQNIISRVTGLSASNIDGLIKANGTANLFLINPNGIIFGPNASLNIGGSFVASTASSLNFADGSQFSAIAPQTKPLLTISVPIGLQFDSNAGSIQVQGNGDGLRRTPDLINNTMALHVQPNRTLALVGGDVALEGGTLKTAGGRIELGSVAAPGLVSLTPIDKGWALSYSGVQNFRDIQLSNQAAVDASGVGGGDIQVRGRRVSLTNGSQIEASTLREEPGGTLSVVASHSVELIGVSTNGRFSSGLFTSVYRGATGSGGNLTIETPQLTVRDGAQIFTGTSGEGPAGSLVVRASDLVEVIGTSSQLDSALSTLVQPRATGAGGNLILETGRLVVRDGAAISTTTFSQGAGGTLSVKARESVEVIGRTANGRLASRLTAQTIRTGEAGNLTIETEQLTVRDGAEVSVNSQGSGNAGNLEVRVRDLLLDKQGKLTATSASGKGGGNIRLQGLDLLLLRHNSEISTNAGGTGNGGNITINTDILAALENSDITANAQKGSGGRVIMNAQGIFGTQFRDTPTLESDITATGGSPELNGTVEINTPDTDPSRALVNLPDELVDVSNQIAQSCPGGGGPNTSKFVVTGRGGIPEDPNEMLNSDTLWTDTRVPITPSENQSSSPRATTEQTKSAPAPLVEANGWVIDTDGEVVLTAAAPSNTLQVPWLNSSICYAS